MTETQANWRPPSWIVGDPDQPYTPEDRTVDGVKIPGVFTLYDMFASHGYYTRGGLLTDKGLEAKDKDDAEAVSHNCRLLRDAWNTNGTIWRFGAKLIGREFAVDPFWNQGAQGLPALERTLDGLVPEDDGMLTLSRARQLLESPDCEWDEETRETIGARLVSYEGGKFHDNYPINWLGDALAPGEGPAASNGPHSCTKEWLRMCGHYGVHDFVCAFVPDNGDGWFQSYAMPADFVVRLGRVPCSPPPGIPPKNSPRGASALCVWIPSKVKSKVAKLWKQMPEAERHGAEAVEKHVKKLNRLLPEPTWRCLVTGQGFRVPLWTRARAGVQYAVVQRSGVSSDDMSDVVDFGLQG